MLRRRFLTSAAAGLLACGVQADDWPARPVRIVVPFPPGGAADAIARTLADRLHGSLGVPCVIDNRPGASGALGTVAVARSAPDGYTLLSHASSIVTQPLLAAEAATYDVLEDLVPVAQTVAGSYVLLVHPDFPAVDLPGFLEAVRRAPGRYSYGSYGSGSGPHLAMELLKAQAGLFILHVPFRGAAPALAELLAGRLDMAFETSFAALPHLRAGRLRAIALGGAHRLEALPGIPAVAETLPGFDTDGWQGLFAPARTPDRVVARLAQEVHAALQDGELARRITALGFRPVGGSPGELAAVVRSDQAKWGRVIRERQLRAD